MIKKIILAMALIGLAGSAFAELKMVVLDTQRALVQSDEAQKLLAQVEEELKQDQEDLQALVTEMRALQERLQTDGDIMSPSEQRDMTKDLENKQIDYQFLVNKLQKEIQDRQNELLQQMGPKVQAVLRDLIELEGYDFIMERGSLQYANSKHDITRRVTEKLNEKYQEAAQ